MNVDDTMHTVLQQRRLQSFGRYEMSNEHRPEDMLYPLYDFITTPNKVLLAHIDAVVSINDDAEQSFAPIYLELSSTPFLTLEFTHLGHPDDYKWHFIASNTIKKITISQIETARYIGQYINPQSGYVVSQWRINEPFEYHASIEQLTEIRFHLINFDIYQGSQHIIETRRVGISYVPEQLAIIELKSDDWVVTISSIYETKAHVNHIRQHPELRLTHMGQLRRRDGSPFSSEQGKKIITRLNSLFSFALGYNYVLVCPVGYGNNGKRWYSYNTPRRARFSRQNWHDAWHRNNQLENQLEVLFPLFINKLNEENWDTTLRSMINWYTTANQSQELEVAIVSIRSAFEKIIPRFSTMDWFHKGYQSTVLNLKDIFTHYKISTDLPDQFNGLHIINKKTPTNPTIISSLIDLLAEERNSYVHEEYKLNRKLSADEVYILVEYGLQLIEQLILKVCTYNDYRVDRISQSG
jgi:hypothetical protein